MTKVEIERAAEALTDARYRRFTTLGTVNAVINAAFPCNCGQCGVLHASDCGVHGGEIAGPCDCAGIGDTDEYGELRNQDGHGMLYDIETDYYTGLPG